MICRNCNKPVFLFDKAPEGFAVNEHRQGYATDCCGDIVHDFICKARDGKPHDAQGTAEGILEMLRAEVARGTLINATDEDLQKFAQDAEDWEEGKLEISMEDALKNFGP